MSYTVVLAYSGGLDTSVIVPWLRETYDARVVCMAADLGQAAELTGIESRARAQGAVTCIVEDLRESFVREAIWPTLRAGAVYARKYLLGTAMARPLIARRQVEIARRLGAQAVAHGCTGKGNDQVRFELSYGTFAPDLAVIAPWREWSIRSREDALAYAAERGIDVAAGTEKIYSRDRNIWHMSHEGGPLEDPAFEPPEDMFLMTRAPEDAPGRPLRLEIGFEKGEPVTVDGEPLGPVALLQRLNAIGGEHGIGRADVVEDRLVGMKSRGVYETPGGTLLHTAHRELEQLVLGRRTLALKDRLAAHYAQLVYDGLWWSLEREALDALVDRTQEQVTGVVRLKLYRGNATVVGRSSPLSLYDEGLASFGNGGEFDHADAAGFIRLFSLSARSPEKGAAAGSDPQVPVRQSAWAGEHTAGPAAPASPATPATGEFARRILD